MEAWNLMSVTLQMEKMMEERFGFPAGEWSEARREAHFLGASLRLQARDLLYLYTDIERIFGISIPGEEIANGTFASFTGVVSLIMNQVKAKEPVGHGG